MTVTDDYLENNKRYAESFTGPLPLPPSKHFAVLACMDARLDVYRILGLGAGEAARDPQRGRRRDGRRDPFARHQPASARYPGDHPHPPHRLRHAHFHDDAFKRDIQDETASSRNWSAEAFPDIDEDVRQSLRRIRPARS